MINTPSERMASSRSQRGVGMMEVLAAMFVLSVGLLGVAALQSQGIRAGQTASYRTMAVIKAKEVVERIRANPNATNAATGLNAYVSAAGDPGSDFGCDDTAGGTLRGKPCSPAQLAAHDLLRWKSSLEDSLPGGQGAVAVNTATTPPTVTVTITWTERGESLTYMTETQI